MRNDLRFMFSYTQIFDAVLGLSVHSTLFITCRFVGNHVLYLLNVTSGMSSDRFDPQLNLIS